MNYSLSLLSLTMPRNWFFLFRKRIMLPRHIIQFFALILPCLTLYASDANSQTNAPTPAPSAPMKVTSETAPIIEATRETLTKWVETKQLISKEKSEWASGKDILEDRIHLLLT